MKQTFDIKFITIYLHYYIQSKIIYIKHVQRIHAFILTVKEQLQVIYNIGQEHYCLKVLWQRFQKFLSKQKLDNCLMQLSVFKRISTALNSVIIFNITSSHTLAHTHQFYYLLIYFYVTKWLLKLHFLHQNCFFCITFC